MHDVQTSDITETDWSELATQFEFKVGQLVKSNFIGSYMWYRMHRNLREGFIFAFFAS